MTAEANTANPLVHAARVRALPAMHAFAGRLQEESSVQKDDLIVEFSHCQRLVAAHAVYQTMLVTCRALNVLPSTTDGALHDDDRGGGAGDCAVGDGGCDGSDGHGVRAGSASEEDCHFQDVSEPLEVIARRLHNYQARVKV
jgi:hypothetical protein